MDIKTFLGADQLDGDLWTFSLPEELNGAFGGMFGGIIAAACIVASRSSAPERVPTAIDCRFLRGLPPGSSRARTTLLHSGRSLSCVSVDVHDERDRLATRATVSLVEPRALRNVARPGAPPPGGWSSVEDAEPWPPVAPIAKSLDIRTVGAGPEGIAVAVLIPWRTGGSPEAACLAADASVGPPVAAAMRGERVATPNPDLSLRFCGEIGAGRLVGLARAERAEGGVAAVRLAVWSDEQLVAIGVSSSLLLGA